MESKTNTQKTQLIHDAGTLQRSGKQIARPGTITELWSPNTTPCMWTGKSGRSSGNFGIHAERQAT